MLTKDSRVRIVCKGNPLDGVEGRYQRSTPAGTLVVKIERDAPGGAYKAGDTVYIGSGEFVAIGEGAGKVATQ